MGRAVKKMVGKLFAKMPLSRLPWSATRIENTSEVRWTGQDSSRLESLEFVIEFDPLTLPKKDRPQ